MSATDEYLHTVERMEPDIHPVDADGAGASISISLKRAADALERIANVLEGVCDPSFDTLSVRTIRSDR